MIRRIARWLDPRSAGPEEPDGPRATPRCRSATPAHHAAGRLVGTADGRGHRAGIVHRVRHVGRLSERPLYIRPVSLAVLFAGDLRQFAARDLRSEAWMVAGLASVLARTHHPALSRTLPRDVLLLSRRVLQGDVGRSAVVHRARTAPQLPRRALIPADSAEHPSVLPLYRIHLSGHPRARRVECALVHGSGHGADTLRHRRRDARPNAERGAPQLLHVRVSLDRKSTRL